MNDEFRDLLSKIEKSSLELVKYKTLYTNKKNALVDFMNSVNSFEDLRNKFNEVEEYLSETSQKVMIGVFKGSVSSEIHYEKKKIEAIQFKLDELSKGIGKQEELL